MINPVRRLTESEQQLKNIELYLTDYKGNLVGVNCNGNPNRTKLPDNCGLYLYNLRHGDDWGIPCTLEKRVVVNFYGSLVSDKELELPINDYQLLKEEKEITDESLKKYIDFNYDIIAEGDYYEYDPYIITALDLLMNKDKIINDINEYYGYQYYDKSGKRID